jgi:hypothetical protein
MLARHSKFEEFQQFRQIAMPGGGGAPVAETMAGCVTSPN